MNQAVVCDRDQLQRLRELLEERTGIMFVPENEYILLKRVCARADELGFAGPEPYLEALYKHEGTDEFTELVAALTVNETFFYRQPGFLRIISNYLEKRFKQEKQLERVRIWSAACAYGCEPYTLAMELETLRLRYPQTVFEIIASDIDEQVLAKGRIGIFSKRQVENKTPPELIERYFHKETERRYRLDAAIRDQIDFRQHNLIADKYPEPVDIILCRNVFIYFSERQRRRVVRQFHRVLHADGILLLGKSESLRDFPEYFLMDQSEDYNFYQKWSTDRRLEQTDKVPRDRRISKIILRPIVTNWENENRLVFSGSIKSVKDEECLEKILTEQPPAARPISTPLQVDLTDLQWCSNAGLGTLRRILTRLMAGQQRKIEFLTLPATPLAEWLRCAGFRKLGTWHEAAATAGEAGTRTPSLRLVPTSNTTRNEQLSLQRYQVSGYVDEQQVEVIKGELKNMIQAASGLLIEFCEVEFLDDSLAPVLRQCQAAVSDADQIRFKGVSGAVAKWAGKNSLELTDNYSRWEQLDSRGRN